MKMSVTIFVHLNESENNNFDIRRFNKDIEIKYPGTSFEVNNSAFREISIRIKNGEKALHVCDRVL